MICRFILLALLSGFLPTKALPAAMLSETRSNFEWFSRLGFPDVKGCPFVRIATGGWSQTTGEQPQNTYIEGFLLATNGNSFSVFTPSLFQHTFTNSAPGTATYKRVGFELVDLRQHAQITLASLQAAPQKDHEWWDFRFDTQLAERARAFVLAWACWRQGFEMEAQHGPAIPGVRSVAGPIPSLGATVTRTGRLCHSRIAALSCGPAFCSRSFFSTP